MILSFKKDAIEINSRKKWLVLGIIIAILNPIFSGLIISLGFLTEPKLRKEGKIILVISVVWAIAWMFLAGWLRQGGYI